MMSKADVINRLEEKVLASQAFYFARSKVALCWWSRKYPA